MKITLGNFLRLSPSALTAQDVFQATTWLLDRPKALQHITQLESHHPAAAIYVLGHRFFRGPLHLPWANPLHLTSWSTVEAEMGDYPGPLQQAWENMLALEKVALPRDEQRIAREREQYERYSRLLQQEVPW